MKILILGGYARSLTLFRGELIAAMVRAGHEVVASAAGNDSEAADRLAAMGVRYVPVHLNRTGMNPFSDLRTFINLTGLFLKERPDMLLAYTIKPVIYGSIAARLAGVRRIFSMITGLGYAFTANDSRQRLVNAIIRRLYKVSLALNRTVFFQNPDDMELFVRLRLVTEDKAVRLNGSGVNLDHYSPAPQVGRPPVFLLIARILRDKGILEYAEAASALKKRYPESSFRLLGPFDGNPSAIKKGEVDSWVDSGCIEYMGETDDVRPFLAGTSVYVLPSYREGTPRSVLEAMSMGRPVITTDVAGCRETVVHGENGFLVPAGDGAALADAMERFILDPGLITRMGNSGRKLVVKKFDVHKVNKVIIDAMGLAA